MKAVIPLAGKGTRLRPHTHHIPKPLVHVAGRPVMSYILDDLIELGVSEIVFIVGYLQDAVRTFMAESYPQIKPHYVVQEVQDGTAGAVGLAEPFAEDELLILFVDTLFDADLTLIQRLPADRSGIIWAKEVEDYQRFGVVVTDDEGVMTRIVEKPSEPVSKLANIGLYYIRDVPLLFDGIRHTLAQNPGGGGEYYLTDAFQYMVDRGSRIQTAPVGGWFDCGKPDALLETNRHLVSTSRGGVDPAATVTDSEIVEPVRIEAGAVVESSTVGPNVTVEADATIRRSEVRDTLIGPHAAIEDAVLHDSLIGERAQVRAFRGSLSVTADSEVNGSSS